MLDFVIREKKLSFKNFLLVFIWFGLLVIYIIFIKSLLVKKNLFVRISDKVLIN